MSPEAFDPEAFGGVGASTDIWALGCCLVEILSGRPPWHGRTHLQIARSIADKHQCPTIPDHLPPPLAAIIRRCLTHDPRRRPTAAQLHSGLIECYSAAASPPAAAAACPPAAAACPPAASSVATTCTSISERHDPKALGDPTALGDPKALADPRALGDADTQGAPPARSPTQSATRSPTQSATRSPTQSATRSPTRSATRSPTQSATRSPTQSAATTAASVVSEHLVAPDDDKPRFPPDDEPRFPPDADDYFLPRSGRPSTAATRSIGYSGASTAEEEAAAALAALVASTASSTAYLLTHLLTDSYWLLTDFSLRTGGIHSVLNGGVDPRVDPGLN